MSYSFTPTSYATVEQADERISYMLNSEDWFEMEDADKLKYLVVASEMIDEIPCSYEREVESQIRLYPVVKNSESAGLSEATEACIRQAFYLCNYHETLESARGDAVEGTKNRNLGGVYMEKFTAGLNPFKKYDGSVLRLLAPFIRMDFNKLRRG